MASKTPAESADAKANELDDEEVEGEQENSTPWFRKIPLKLIIIAAGALIVLGGGATGGDRTQYLKVKIVLEVADSTFTSQIQSAMPRVMDTFQTYLRELRPTDLGGSAGLYRLKEELTRRVNLAIAPSRINAVLFKEIVVQ